MSGLSNLEKPDHDMTVINDIINDGESMKKLQSKLCEKK